MKTAPLSEAKTHLSELAEEVDRTHERVTITRNGRDHVVLMSVEDLAEIEATLELLNDPEARERVKRSETEIARGEALSAEESAALLESLRKKPAK
ncbi:type II toxin-antitoxin system Phd/YefM family antitoxin [Allosalinactinospora lopnorensis]|uniref:type II toxin-antitoxin system Phd/YefM family antitoxin n=1 Tax=Allosalinactinospora lopnorensis TaxID=1352348 RepID=UPI000623BA72|nr:type II toxin-antitoxin system Phd/YefM family antitoxin [Allosalinactinospora lopnorensis]